MSTGPRRIGKYELRELLGRGGMAEVWQAFDTQLERYVAIKLLHADLQNDPDFIIRFEREARAIASLHHPNIVKIHDFQTSAGNNAAQSGPAAYMVMEYIKGQTLTEYISNTSRIGKFPSAADIIYLFTCISSAIDYAHQHRMIHRDIKPANILLDQRSPSRYQMGEPILTDFGIVKLMGASTGTQSGSWLGTPLYISPEQAQGKPGNERSDLYSLAVILYEICTGQRPFQGENPIAIIMQHITAAPTSPSLINPMITPALSEVILRGLAKDPEARFPSASSMKTALVEAFNMSAPVILGRDFSREGASEPTWQHPFQPALPSTIMPSASPSPSSPPTPVVGSLTSVFAVLDTEQNVSATPRNSILNNMSVENSSVPSLEPLSSFPPLPKRRRRIPLVILLTLALFILTGSGVFYWLSHQSPAAISVVGYASFSDSRQGGANYSQGIQGINDELQIDLHNIPDPSPGKSYYAWLLGDKPDPSAYLPLGQLPFDHNSMHFLYRGDQQHTNLIGTTSRLLITEENVNSTSGSPFQNQSTWRYYAELPQEPLSIGVHKRAIDILRVLLADNVEMKQLGLHGGSSIHLLLNSQQVLQWAISARNAWKGESTDTAFLHDQVIRILDYLDGASSVQSDLPPNTPLLVDQTLATISLLKLPNNLGSGSYIGGVNNDLVALVHEPGVTSSMGQVAKQADTALLGNVSNSLNQVHQDAKKLVNMTSAQLLLPSTMSVLNDMATQANYAYNGQNEPSSSASQGVVWIYHQIQQLVTFNITPYQQH